MTVSVLTEETEDAIIAVVANAEGLIKWVDQYGLDDCGPEGGRDAWLNGLRASLASLRKQVKGDE